MANSGTTPNWAALVEQGRAKSYGVPWSDKELHAIYELKIPVDYVRQGILTLEELNKERDEVTKKEAQGDKPVHYMTKAELKKMAEELGIVMSGDLDRFELMRLVKDELEKEEKRDEVVEDGNVQDESNQSEPTLPQSDEGDGESGARE